MREIRQSGSEGGEAELNRPSLPLSFQAAIFVYPGSCFLFSRPFDVERISFPREFVEILPE
jgi:hypothetical protein